MGQSSSPTVYQQPSQQEIAANQATNQQKAAALAKLNQSIFAESRGLRGMGGLYEWAGPTPDMAANMTAANMWKKPQPEDEPPWQEEGGTGRYPPGYIPGTQPGAWRGWASNAGPRGDRGTAGPIDMLYKFSSSGSRGDRTGPGWVQDTDTLGGPKGDRTGGPRPSTYQQQYANWQNTTRGFAAQGVPASALPKAPVAPPPQKTPDQIAAIQYAGLDKRMAAAGFPASALPKPPVIGPPPQAPKPNAAAQSLLGLKPAAAQAATPAAQPASAPSTRPAVSAAPAAQTPIAPVKPLVPTAATKPLSNIIYQTMVRPSIYQSAPVSARGAGPKGG